MPAYFLAFNTSNSLRVLCEDNKSLTGIWEETSLVFTLVSTTLTGSSWFPTRYNSFLFPVEGQQVQTNQPSRLCSRMNEHQTLRYFSRQMIKSIPRIETLFFPYFKRHHILYVHAFMYVRIQGVSRGILLYYQF